MGRAGAKYALVGLQQERRGVCTKAGLQETSEERVRHPEGTGELSGDLGENSGCGWLRGAGLHSPPPPVPAGPLEPDVRRLAGAEVKSAFQAQSSERAEQRGGQDVGRKKGKWEASHGRLLLELSGGTGTA